MILAILTFIFCLLWADVKVEKVLETTSIKEYNQWVKRNKARYRGLKPIYITVEQIHKSTSENDRDKYKINYFNANGDLEKQEFIEGWFEMAILSDGEFLFIAQREHKYYPINETRILKNKNGDTLINLSAIHSHTIKYWGKSFWIENNSYEGGPGDNPTIRIFDHKGTVIGKIKNAWLVSCMITDMKEKYLFLIINEKDEISEAVLLYDIDNEELWRKKFNSAVNIAISNDGSYTAVGDSGKIYVFNKQGEIVYTSQAFTSTQRNPSIIFSDDNQYLAAILGSEVCFYNNKTGELLWQRKIDDPDPGEKFIYLFETGNVFYIMIAYLSNYVYILNTEGKIVKKFQLPFGYTWRYKKTATGDVIKNQKVAVSKWSSKFYDGLLIIKKDINTIIYKIVPE